jgi:putative nucleotidyltransferase with HDIG domain
VLASDGRLATHSLTVGFLGMGLARILFDADAASLVLAGLAGVLHDVGRVGHEAIEHDPEHAERGAAILRGLGLPLPVVEAARSHHERFDGSGYPRGLRGARIPELARVVGIVDTFDKVYSGHQPRVGVFDALRILAQAYRGCFDEHLAQGLVRLFR